MVEIHLMCLVTLVIAYGSPNAVLTYAGLFTCVRNAEPSCVVRQRFDHASLFTRIFRFSMPVIRGMICPNVAFGKQGWVCSFGILIAPRSSNTSSPSYPRAVSQPLYTICP